MPLQLLALLHKDVSDPREVYLLIGIDFGSLSEGDIESLRNQRSSCATGDNGLATASRTRYIRRKLIRVV